MMGEILVEKDGEFYQIRPARSGEAQAIYNLKTEIFAKKFLPFTVFQSPKSVIYISELIKSSEQPTPRIFVLHQLNKILGYYHATHLAEEYFLDYIGITLSAQGHGLGRLLLNHFEKNGRDFGCHCLVLDVFDSNLIARDWYLSLGYRIQTSSFHARINLSDVVGISANCLLSFSDSDYQRACNEEQLRGFSKIECYCGQGKIQLGLIAGHTCRLLGYTDVTLHEAVGAIAYRFHQERTILIILSLPDLPSDIVYLNIEKSLRLIKPC